MEPPICQIFQSLIDVGQSIALILIILGALQAFLWKLAFYINLVIGIILTVVITYALSLIQVPFTWLVVFFIIGLAASLVIAVLGAVIALLDGWFSCAVGLFLIGLINRMTLTTSILFGVVGGAIIVAIAAGIGAYADTFLIRSLGRLGAREGGRGWRRREDMGTRGGRYPRRDNQIPHPPPAPVRNFPEQTIASQQELCEICRLDFVYQGSNRALKCPSCQRVFHHDCLNEWVKLNGRCPHCGLALDSI